MSEYHLIFFALVIIIRFILWYPPTKQTGVRSGYWYQVCV